MIARRYPPFKKQHLEGCSKCTNQNHWIKSHEKSDLQMLILLSHLGTPKSGVDALFVKPVWPTYMIKPGTHMIEPFLYDEARYLHEMTYLLHNV